MQFEITLQIALETECKVVTVRHLSRLEQQVQRLLPSDTLDALCVKICILKQIVVFIDSKISSDTSQNTMIQLQFFRSRFQKSIQKYLHKYESTLQ